MENLQGLVTLNKELLLENSRLKDENYKLQSSGDVKLSDELTRKTQLLQKARTSLRQLAAENEDLRTQIETYKSQRYRGALFETQEVTDLKNLNTALTTQV